MKKAILQLAGAAMLCFSTMLTFGQITTSSVRDDLRGYFKMNEFGGSFSGSVASGPFTIGTNTGANVKLGISGAAAGVSPIITILGTGDVYFQLTNYSDVNITTILGLTTLSGVEFHASSVVNRNNAITIRNSIDNDITITGTNSFTVGAVTTVGGTVLSRTITYTAPTVASPQYFNSVDINFTITGSMMDNITISGRKTNIPTSVSTTRVTLPVVSRHGNRRGNISNLNANNNDILFGRYFTITGVNTVAGFEMFGVSSTVIGPNDVMYEALPASGADATYNIYDPIDLNPAKFTNEKLSLRVGGRGGDGNFSIRNWINFNFQGAFDQFNNNFSVVTITNAADRVFAAYFKNLSPDPCIVDVRPNNSASINLITVPGNTQGWFSTSLAGVANGVIGGIMLHFYYPLSYLINRQYGNIEMYNFLVGIHPNTLPSVTGISINTIGGINRMDPNFLNSTNSNNGKQVPLNISIIPSTALQEFDVQLNEFALQKPLYDISANNQPTSFTLFSKSIVGIASLTVTAIGAPFSANYSPIYVSEDFNLNITSPGASITSSTTTSTVLYSKPANRILIGASLSSSNPNIATVSQEGIISVLSVGVTSITAISTGLPGKTAILSFQVEDFIIDYNLTVSSSVVTSTSGTVFVGVSNVFPSGASIDQVNISVMPQDAGTIEAGVFTPFKNGVITFVGTYSLNESLSKIATVTITGAIGLTITGVDAITEKGGTAQFTSMVENTTLPVMWMSSNSDVASVSGTGLVQAISDGITTIVGSVVASNYTLTSAIVVTVSGQSTGIISGVSSSIKVYPNPASGTDVSVEGGDVALKSVTVVSAAGTSVLKVAGVNGKASVPTSGLSKGLYILLIETDKGFGSKTLSVE